MNDPISNQELLEWIQSEHTALQASIEKLSEAQMLETGVEGVWSVKDLMVHIPAWEQIMIQWLEENARGEVPEQPQTQEDLEQINELVYLENRDRTLADVRFAFQGSYQEAFEAFEAIDGLTQDELFEPRRYAWNEDKPLWQMVAANTCQHYQEHSLAIRRWLSLGDS
jgi:hypothetical protein